MEVRREGVSRMWASWSLPLGIAFTAYLATSTGVTVTAAEESRRIGNERRFTLEVLPLLKEKCFACHGADRDELQGGFDITSREGLLHGGESGDPGIVVGQPDKSLLIEAVRWESFEMPPKENDRLDEEQIAVLSAWIAEGAHWPNEEQRKEYLAEEWSQAETADGLLVETSGGLSDEWTYRRYAPENLWAYRPLRSTNDFSLGDSDTHPVDAFIDARLKALGLAPAPRADRRTLIRRATFDLLGLPPTPQEVAEFVDDPRDDETVFAELIEKLLASPHYGEKWGQHWLDVVRYADSSGFANDFERGNAWRYRDYVVRAFNSDLPYDQFIRQQIAGDEIDPADPEMLIAVGFLRMGAWELTGMEVARIARQRFLDDVTDTVGQVFLGHMLQCARCHDHKFDPVPTRDYYGIQAAFATTQLAERKAAFLPEENTAGFEERRYLQQRREHYQSLLRELDALSIEAARAWYAEQEKSPENFEKRLAKLREKSGSNAVVYDQIRRGMRNAGVSEEDIPPRHAGFSPREFGIERVARKGLQRLTWRQDRYAPFALSVYSGRTPNLTAVYTPQRMPKQPMKRGELETTSILVGGDPFSALVEVEPTVLSAAYSLSQGDVPESPVTDAIAGRRRDLAEWIASAENPLTARVMVNRIWQWHFGQAIAGNPNNFGTTGKKPTHPELLDWLAATLIEQGWSVKAMHRLIMTSDAYTRASTPHDAEKLATKDPQRTSYAVFQPRRLTAEEIRDAMLRVSGELNLEVGGIPVCPDMNQEAALQPRMVMGSFAEAWQASPLPEQRNRRSLYALKLRGLRDPYFEVFNSPSPDLSCEARDVSTVTPQVFSLFNSNATYSRALAFAVRVTGDKTLDGENVEEPIRKAIELAYGRPADPEELEACYEHWERMLERHSDVDFARFEPPREVIREAVEENTGERFSFVEPLEVAADYVPSLQPADVIPEVRALAEVCLVLLNSNEFVYVY